MIPINKKLIIIVGILAVIIVLFFVSGLYSKIIKLNPKISQAPTQTKNPQFNAAPIILARSEIPDYVINTAINQAFLIQILNKMGIWGKIYNTGSQKGTKPLSQFFVVLTGTKQQYEVHQNKNKDLFFSVGLTFQESTVAVNINLSPSALAQTNNSQTLDIAALYGAFILSNPNATKPNSPDSQKFASIIQSYLNANTSLFQIIKASSASASPSLTPTPTK